MAFSAIRRRDKSHRDMGTPSKNVRSAGTKAEITCNKGTIQPNNKAPRRTLTLTILYEKRLNWNKLETFF